MNDKWIDRVRAESDAASPRAEFQPELRAVLEDEWEQPAATQQHGHRPSNRPGDSRWIVGSTAAALVAILIGSLVLLSRDDESPLAPMSSASTDTSATAPSIATTTIAPGSTAAPVAVTVPSGSTTTLAPAPTTEPATMTTMVTTMVTTTVPPVGELPVGLASWPPRSADDPALATAPALWPSVAVPGAATVQRNEWNEADEGTVFYDYTQAWYAADGSGYLVITTGIDQIVTPNEFSDPIDATGWATQWDAAWWNGSAAPYTNATLTSPGGHVTLHALGLDEAVVTAIGESLRRRPQPTPGWDVPGLPDSMVPFAEGGDVPGATRQLLWLTESGEIVAELIYGTHLPDLVSSGGSFGEASDVIDINGHPAVVADVGGRVSITWSPIVGIEALLGLIGTRDEAVAIASSLEIVDEATWRAVATPPIPGNDGCNSLFC